MAEVEAMTGQNDDLIKTVERAIRSLDECG